MCDLVNMYLNIVFFCCISVTILYKHQQERQADLKLAIDIACQATPSPKAKATMELLQAARKDLIEHSDGIMQSMMNAEKNKNDNDTFCNSDANGNTNTYPYQGKYIFYLVENEPEIRGNNLYLLDCVNRIQNNKISSQILLLYAEYNYCSLFVLVFLNRESIIKPHLSRERDAYTQTHFHVTKSDCI